MGENRLMADLWEINQRLNEQVEELQQVNSKLTAEKGSLEKRLEELQIAKAVDDAMIAQYDDDFKTKSGMRAVAEIERLREKNKVLISECDRLIKEKGELLKKSEQIAKYKSLLKEAVEDFDVYGALKDLPAAQRVKHSNWRRFNRILDVLDHRWRCADEALKLIGEDGEQK